MNTIRGQAGQAKSAAPYFTLEDYQGNTVRLSDFRGKTTLIAFWFPACGACREELPKINDFARQINSPSLAILAIDVYADQETGEKFKNEKNLNLVFLNGSLEMAQTWEVSQTPTLFLLDKDGELVMTSQKFDRNFQEEIRRRIQK